MSDVPASEDEGVERIRQVRAEHPNLSNQLLLRFDFYDPRYEGRRLFSELLGTFMLVFVAAGASLVNARFGGAAVPYGAQMAAPGLMVGAVNLFMGAVSGAHLNPGVSLAFAIRGDFPWRRLPGYVIVQLVGAALATVVLVAVVGKHGTAGLTLPGHGVSTTTAMLWEMILTAGLVSVVLGTASGAQNLGSLGAIAVASYIALAGLIGAPVSGASMNTARSFGPALVLSDWTAWWAYLVGPLLGAFVATLIAFVLRGPGGGRAGRAAAQGTIGERWFPGPFQGDEGISSGAIDPATGAPPAAPASTSPT